MIKKTFLASMLVMLSVVVFAQPKAKYVFYFIGDGMGVNQVNATETYLGALKGVIGVEPICFASFPNSALVNTQSATNGVTDSAAGGTALATGNKTKNGAIGTLKDQTTPVKSIAEAARDAGAAVGVSTTVSIDHATPAAFYAHVKDRNMYHEIGVQLTKSNFDFFAASDFLEPVKDNENLYELSEKAGYTIARGLADYKAKEATSERMILFQTEEASKKDKSCLPYALDRSDDDLTLKQIAESGIDFLMDKKKDGFFFMLEGGRIDWSCHSNDAAPMIAEVIDMDEAVKVAYEFYKQHPDETLIVITADHETGGLVLGRGPYELHLDVLQNQRQTVGTFTKMVDELRKEKGDNLQWEDVKALLTKGFGFWDKVKLSDKQTARLQKVFDKMKAGNSKDTKSMYARQDELANTAKDILAEIALVGWQSGGHSNGYVPVFAIGAGAEQFHGRMDNTMIPKIIAKSAGWNL